MANQGSQSHRDGGRQSALALAVLGLLGQVGCVTALVILAALAAGLWVDAQLDTRPVFTLAMVLASVPLTLYLMIRIVLGGMDRLHRAAGTYPPSSGNWEAKGGGNPDSDA